MSWRIDVIEDDRSRTVLPSTGGTGASVINSKKGKEKPVYFSKGQESRILELLGYPDSSYPDVWEVIQYNKEAPIWVSAPSLNGLYGFVLVTKTGTIPMTVGLADRDTLNFSQIEYKQQVGVGDGLTTNFTDTLDLLPYVNQSIDLEVDGVSLAVVASDAEPEVLTGTNISSGTLTRATGALDVTFTTAPADGEVIEAVFQSNQSAEAYFALFTASPQEDGDIGIITQYNTNTGFFEITLFVKNNKNVWREVNVYTVSETSGTLDGFGENIYVEEVFNSDHDYLYAKDNTLVYSTFTDDTSRVNLEGGSRGDAITITEHTAGWAYYQNRNTYPADIFMDFSALSGIPTIFDNLRTTYQKYKYFLLPLPLADDVSSAITTKAGYSINNRGLAFYWNWGKARDIYGGTSGFWTSLIGKVGVKFAQMRDIYNGKAPCWVDENNHGGQLGSGVIELKYDATEDELQQLDEAGINPIIFDLNYGVMVVSQRTAQSIGTISDSSWIGHSRAFDYVIYNILTQVLVFQITKLNDETHRQMASSLGQSILDPMVNAGIFTDATIKCDSENNNDTVRSQRKFVYQVFVKVTPFAEKIEFIFTNVGQNIDVEELI